MTTIGLSALALAVVDRDTGRGWIEEELSKDEYSANDLTPLEIIGSWLTETWNRLLTTALAGNSPWLLLAVALAVVLIIALIVWRVRRLGLRRAALPPRPLDALLAAPEPGPWRTSAEEAAARGDHRAALIDRARAIFAVLGRAGIVDLDGASTASEIGRIAAAALPERGPELTRVAAVFNDLVFGHDSPGAAHSETELRSLYTEFSALDLELERRGERSPEVSR